MKFFLLFITSGPDLPIFGQSYRASFGSKDTLVPRHAILCMLFRGVKLHGPSMFAVKAKIYGVLYKQSSSIAFDETSSYWSAPKNS